MIAHFLTGLIIGVLLGLALAPLLRSWILWQIATKERDRAIDEGIERLRAQQDNDHPHLGR